ncbi:MAG: lytic transglycosylase domain-containing protein [Vampirovibrio sp.]
MPINRQTFKVLLEEELQKASRQKGGVATVPVQPKFPQPLSSMSTPSTKGNGKLQPFSFADLEKKPSMAPPTALPMAFQARRATFSQDVNKLSQKYGMDPLLIDAVIRQESGYQPHIVSKSGAIGLMQLMPSTAAGLGVQNPYDPIQNLEGGIKYLGQQLERFGGNVSLALAAYNAGPNAVSKYGGIPPYGETQRYVRNILKHYLAQKYQ